MVIVVMSNDWGENCNSSEKEEFHVHLKNDAFLDLPPGYK